MRHKLALVVAFVFVLSSILLKSNLVLAKDKDNDNPYTVWYTDTNTDNARATRTFRPPMARKSEQKS